MAITIFHKVTNNNKVTIINKDGDTKQPSTLINAKIADKSHKLRRVARK